MRSALKNINDTGNTMLHTYIHVENLGITLPYNFFPDVNINRNDIIEFQKLDNDSNKLDNEDKNNSNSAISTQSKDCIEAFAVSASKCTAPNEDVKVARAINSKKTGINITENETEPRAKRVKTL